MGLNFYNLCVFVFVALEYMSHQSSDLLPISTGFTIYQSPSCSYCRKALMQIKTLSAEHNIPYRNIDLNYVSGDLPSVLEYFKNHSKQYKFRQDHKTRPIIFLNGRFVGGAFELSKLIEQTSN